MKDNNQLMKLVFIMVVEWIMMGIIKYLHIYNMGVVLNLMLKIILLINHLKVDI